MKEDIYLIRTESNTCRSQINELNVQINKIFLKYTDNEIGYKEMKKQISKMCKLKEEIVSKILQNIKSLEQIESKAIEDSKKDSSKK